LFCTNLCFVEKEKKNELLETMALSLDESPSDYFLERKGAMELAYNDTILAKNEFLSQLEVLTKQRQHLSENNAIQVSHLVCEFCGGGHQGECCGTFGNGYEGQTQVNYMGYSHGVNFYSQANTYYPHLRNNPLSFNQNPLFSNHNQPLTQSFNQNSPQFTYQPHFYSNPLFNPNPQNLSIK
jgi:hypothetical protein